MAETFGCTPASVTIIPENECPARTVGPSCRVSTRSAASTASGSVVSGFCTEVTRSPAACNRGITSDQLDPSAKRPCTNTTSLALGALCAEAVCERSELVAVAAAKRIKPRLSMSPSPYFLRALVVHDRAPRPMKFHHHSGDLFQQLCQGRRLPMDLECSVVPIYFVGEKFRVVVLSQQDF